MRGFAFFFCLLGARPSARCPPLLRARAPSQACRANAHIDNRNGHLLNITSNPTTITTHPIAADRWERSQLASLLAELVAALNEKEIPTGASLLESFNAQLVARAMRGYAAAMDGVGVPIDEAELGKVRQSGREGGRVGRMFSYPLHPLRIRSLHTARLTQ